MAQSGPADQMINSQAGTKYWQEADASDNGMLGGVLGVAGFASVSRIDLQGSRTFLARLGIGAKRGRNLVATALDAGAGIGRITEGLLLHVAEQVDIIEPVSKFTDPLKDKAGVRHIFNVGLQAWHPPRV
uniref:Alpha N-terminal protein methyltransferase 1 n=1 Tax=Bionectria ochroleuca TaxID=29856 RepID=A0A8H7NEG1_BIOOC